MQQPTRVYGDADMKENNNRAGGQADDGSPLSQFQDNLILLEQMRAEAQQGDG